jgi:hypothetical protein
MDASPLGELAADCRLDLLAHSGPAQPLALRAGAPEPGLHPLHDHGPLERGGSNAANTPSIWNMALPAGVEVSSPNWWIRGERAPHSRPRIAWWGPALRARFDLANAPRSLLPLAARAGRGRRTRTIVPKSTKAAIR